MTRERTNPWLWFGLGVAGIFWFATRAKAATPSAPATRAIDTGLPIQAGTVNIPELPASMAPTTGELQSSGSLWDTLMPVDPRTSGYINFPGGSQAAAATFRYGNTRVDTQGNTYVQWAGITYQLGPQDASGNWPAMLANAG